MLPAATRQQGRTERLELRAKTKRCGLMGEGRAVGKQALRRKNCFEGEEISSEREGRAEVSEASWSERVAAD